MKPLNTGHLQSKKCGPLFGCVRYSDGLIYRKFVDYSLNNLRYSRCPLKEVSLYMYMYIRVDRVVLVNLI